jgi:hypothetical protein
MKLYRRGCVGIYELNERAVKLPRELVNSTIP